MPASLAAWSAVLIGALSLLMYWPMLRRQVPFPAQVVTQFPPWDAVRVGPPPAPHAEMGDLVTELYPWKRYTRQSIASGTFPLWNPYLLLGAPFLGDMQTGLFYPPNLVYYAMTTPKAWSLSILLRTVLAGLLAALLAQALGATRTAALAGGVIFAFCGWVTAFQTRPHLDTSLWLPLVLLGIDRLQRRPRGSSVALAAAAFALPVLAGQPENAAHVTFVALLFFAYRLAWRPPDAARASRGRFTLLFAAAGVLAVALAAVQILPGLEFILQLERGVAVPFGPKPLHEAAAFLSRDLSASPNSARVFVPESAAYAGMLTLLVAPLAWLHRNRRDVVFFLVLLACVLQIVYGFGPIYPLALHTPVLMGIPNGRLLVVADLCLAILAALGLSAWETSESKGRLKAPWLLATGALAVCAAGVAYVLSHAAPALRAGAPGVLAWWRSPVSSAVALGAAAVLLILGLARRIPRRRFAAWALGFCALDLVTAGYGFFPFTPSGEIYPPAPTFSFLERDPEPHRVASVDRTWGASFEWMYGLQSATGYTVFTRRLTRFLTPLGFRDDYPYLVAEKVARSPTRVLDLANVKYLGANTWNKSDEVLASRPDRFRLVYSDLTVRVFENLAVLPRAFLVPFSGIRVVSGERPELTALHEPDFDPRKTVLLPASPPPPASAAPAENPGVDGFTQAIHSVAMRARVSEPSILVVSQMHYPGWKAVVDGRDAPLLRADYTLVGVALAPGVHDVRLVYRPESFRIGAAISAVALLVALGASASRRRERAASGAAASGE
ncbi:MAG TPA: YfhO family protein [Thermoanaerobaculia bacterium]